MQRKQRRNNKNTDLRYKTRLTLLLDFVKGSKKYFLAGLIFAALGTMFEMVLPKIIAYTVDSVINDTGSESANLLIRTIMESFGNRDYLRSHIYIVALSVIIISLIVVCFRYFFRLYNAKASERLIKRIRDMLYEHILRLPMSWHTANHTGDIIQRCTSDVETVKSFLSEHLINFVRVIILIIISVAFMVSINPYLTIVALILMPVIVAYSAVFHNRIAASFLHVDEMEGVLSSIAQENLTGIRVVRAFGKEIYEKKRFESMNEKYIGTWIHLMKLLSAYWATGDLISGLQVLLIISGGAYFCVKGWMSAGEYIAFVTYNAMMTWPIRMLGRVISEMGKAGISIDRILYIMNSQAEEEPSDVKEDIRSYMSGDIVFEHVSFSYDGTNSVLSDVSFKADAGSTIGILGGTGSGKTTLMELLDRIYDLKDGNGRITAGGRDIKTFDRNEYRKNIGMVLQEPFLFSGTIRENISIMEKNPDMKSIEKVVGIASLQKTIKSFVKGYDTYVGERGVTLSGGQKQRTAIAQMLLRNTPVMIFDDSLSAVDADTDIRIREELKKNDNGATKFLIAHRISTIMDADLIIVLDKGQITETGTHEELIKQNGRYKKIYDLQNRYR
ncbi:MAG: ABC transporter ATP-binding protein/permease [Lachnospiraceae bacterium]|nr:ABC transporter ATP-binding protein/permease [Lachnospiraceae bacterium]